MIEDETETNLVWTFDSNYKNSLIHEWLNNYLDTQDTKNRDNIFGDILNI